jgi:hypothetical protein
MNIFMTELRHCLKRKEMHIVFLILLIFSTSAFVMECIAVFGADLKLVRSAAESSLFQGVYASTVRSTLLFIFPLIASIAFSDSFYTDYHNGVLKVILTKVNKAKYIFNKAIVIFLATFSTFFIALLINQILTLITFPSVGFDNIYALPAYDIGVQNYDENYFLDLLRLESPFLFNLISILIISIFAGLFSLFTFGMYFHFLSKGRVFGLFISFLVYIGFNLILGLLHFNELTIMHQIKPIHTGTLTEIFIWFVIILIGSIYLIIRGSKKEFIN